MNARDRENARLDRIDNANRRQGVIWNRRRAITGQPARQPLPPVSRRTADAYSDDDDS